MHVHPMLLIAAALLLGACASVREPAARLARAQPVTDEIACMAECLQDGSESCDSCASDCLGRASAGQVASGN